MSCTSFSTVCVIFLSDAGVVVPVPVHISSCQTVHPIPNKCHDKMPYISMIWNLKASSWAHCTDILGQSYPREVYQHVYWSRRGLPHWNRFEVAWIMHPSIHFPWEPAFLNPIFRLPVEMEIVALVLHRSVLLRWIHASVYRRYTNWYTVLFQCCHTVWGWGGL